MTDRSLIEHADAVAAYLPNGPLFEAKSIGGSNLRGLIKGLAGEFKRMQDAISLLQSEYLPDATSVFLEEWESALGIPDECFNGTGSLAERQTWVLAKLASMGVQTESDFEALVVVFGLTADVIPGYTYGRAHPGYFADDKTARHSLVVEFTVLSPDVFPYAFPLTFGSARLGLMRCLLSRLIPSDGQIFFEEV